MQVSPKIQFQLDHPSIKDTRKRFINILLRFTIRTDCTILRKRNNWITVFCMTITKKELRHKSNTPTQVFFRYALV